MQRALRLALTAIVALPARAADPVVHLVDSAKEMLAGELSSVTVDGNGRVALGPDLDPIGEVTEPVVWSAAVDGDGRIYLGTGHDGRVLATGKGGRGDLTVVLDTEEVEVTALAHDGKDTLYAATSPDGKVYALKDGESTVLYDPDDKYVWALLLDGGSLLVGTGAQARVHRVSTKGESEVLFTSHERNVTCLAKVGTAIYAGTDDRGKLYRIGAGGTGFAVWDSALREVTSLASDAEGRLYASAVDMGRASGASPPAPPAGGTPGSDAPAAAPPPPPPPLPAAGTGRAACEIVRLTTSGETAGSIEVLHASADEPILRLAVEAGGTVLLPAATSPEARLYRLDPGRGATVLGKVREGQVTALAALPDGGAVLATSNPGGLFRLAAAPADRGSITGAVLDAGGVARFGLVTYASSQPPPGTVRVRIRTGNTLEAGPDWSPWSDPLASGARVPGAPSRYLQWRAELLGGGATAPSFERLSVTSVQHNLAPVVDAVTVLPSGIVFKASSLPQEPPAPGLPDDRDLFSMNLPGLPEPPAASPGSRRYDFRRGMRTVTWAARDPNGDELTFSLELRRAGDAHAVPLKDDFERDWYTFDTTSLPDGAYVVELLASDRASNGLDGALSGSRASQAFDVDNTPPRVKATRHEGGILVQASDDGGLFRAFISASGGPWQPISPEDGISDGPAEAYRIDPSALGLSRGGMVLVKIFDRAGNVGADAVTLPDPR